MNITLRHAFIILGIIALPPAGYALTRLMVYLTPVLENSFLAGLVGLIVVLTILAIPFLMLRGIFHDARLRSRDEKELHLKDLPKHQDTVSGERRNFTGQVEREDNRDNMQNHSIDSRNY